MKEIGIELGSVVISREWVGGEFLFFFPGKEHTRRKGTCIHLWVLIGHVWTEQKFTYDRYLINIWEFLK